MPGDGTHIKLGSGRIGLSAGSSILDAAELLEILTRINIRSLRDDPRLRTEMIRRVLSPPCETRCYVSQDGVRNDCNCASGFQWTSDPEAQALQGCPARDVWNDIRSLSVDHATIGRGPHDPIAADCDCLTPASLSVAAYLAWMAPKGYAVGGVALGAVDKRSVQRFAVGITLPPDIPGKERIGHAYGLVNYRPPAPQPEVRVAGLKNGPWWVWDASCHWGMNRPPNEFYTTGEYVAVEVRRDALDGLKG